MNGWERILWRLLVTVAVALLEWALEQLRKERDEQ